MTELALDMAEDNRELTTDCTLETVDTSCDATEEA